MRTNTVCMALDLSHQTLLKPRPLSSVAFSHWWNSLSRLSAKMLTVLITWRGSASSYRHLQESLCNVSHKMVNANHVLTVY